MLKGLLRLLARPVTWPVAAFFRWTVRRRLGRVGVLEWVAGDDPHPLVTLRLLERAMDRDRVRGLLLHLRGPGWGWAALAEWREALQRWRDRGQLVVVNLEAPGNGDLWLASAADRIVLTPAGEVGLVGVATSLSFFGGLAERLGVRFDVEAAGTYKSMGETFTRTFATTANREAVDELIADLHAELVEGIAEGRELDRERVQELVDCGPHGANEALDHGLVDRLAYEDELDEVLADLLGPEVERVPAERAMKALARAARFDGFLDSTPKVAVVHLEGGVVMGDGRATSRPQITARQAPEVLRGLRDHPGVKAVVLHVQSPGGSALASDLIAREVELLNRVKPVVASFGNVSASGGYYIAAPASEIVARPNTLTGSIGVVGGKLVLGEALAKLGVFSERVSRGANAGMYGSEEGFDEAQRARFRARLEQTYATFLRRVAGGRKQPVEAVHEVAQGRIWSGRSAHRVGLVDHLGGLTQALERARALAGLRPAQAWRRLDVLVKPRRPLWMRMIPGVDAFAWTPAALLDDLPTSTRMLAEHPVEPLALLPLELMER